MIYNTSWGTWWRSWGRNGLHYVMSPNCSIKGEAARSELFVPDWASGKPHGPLRIEGLPPRRWIKASVLPFVSYHMHLRWKPLPFSGIWTKNLRDRRLSPNGGAFRTCHLIITMRANRTRRLCKDIRSRRSVMQRIPFLNNSKASASRTPYFENNIT